MDGLGNPMPPTETKIFDPRDATSDANGAELVDPSVVQRDDRWFMYVAGQPHGYGPTDIFSASLPQRAPLSATGWKPTRDPAGELIPIAGHGLSSGWDGKGGRHCPSYVRGWNPSECKWVERIYYAGAAENLWGPYSIGFLEWNGERWIDQPEPVFCANEEWEHSSVYEPNLIYHDGKWKLWYVAGSNHEDYIVHGYAESADGRTNWGKHAMFAPPEMKMFDFCLRQRGDIFNAVFSRVWLKESTSPAETGLWWCTADRPYHSLADWSRPVQIMTAENRQWHSGPWKPSFEFQGQHGDRALVFFDGMYRTNDPGPFPFAFTVGCLEIDLQRRSEPT
jgi:predicted GH43/DUF377 family glycosyl hydrolase